MLHTEQSVAASFTLLRQGLAAPSMMPPPSHSFHHPQYLGWIPVLGKGPAGHLEDEIKVEEARMRLEV